MAYDAGLVQRIREYLTDRSGLTEKKMFGGVAFMIYGNMCCGVNKDNLMLRVGPEQYSGLLKQPGARPMDFTGKPLKGMLYIDPASIEEDSDLAAWIDHALTFVQSLPAK